MSEAHVFFRGGANHIDFGGILPTLGYIGHGQPLVHPCVVNQGIQLEHLRKGEGMGIVLGLSQDSQHKKGELHLVRIIEGEGGLNA